jgi:hypothetical protein
MSKIALEGNASGTGTFTIAGPNTNTNYTITLPQETGTLVTTGVTTGLNGSAISTGVVAASVGGTGANTLTSENVIIGNGTASVKFVAPGTASNVLTSNGTAWVSQAAAAGGGDYIMQVFTSPGTYTKPAGLKAIKVTVIGGGGGSGPTAGGTSSFGSPAFLSATGGASAPGGSAGGAGSNGQLNAPGEAGVLTLFGCGGILYGGGSAFGFGGSVIGSSGSNAGRSYGGGATSNGGCGGGGGGAIEYIDAPALPGPQPYTVGTGGSINPSYPGTTGAAGVIIVEEFY